MEQQTIQLLDSIKRDTTFDLKLSSDAIIECYWTNESNNRLGIMCLPVEGLLFIRLRSDNFRDTNWVVFKNDVFNSARVYYLIRKDIAPDLLSLHDYLKNSDSSFYSSIYDHDVNIYPTYNPIWYTKFLNDKTIYTIRDWDLMMFNKGEEE
ncbi:hypothetical protein [Owenweeksia hongkongensis]|uniref:hypothetical protein n=1 Tax=Owenweeksia hongkongensis TaxID=253245 RepID=UPI003A92D872